MQSGRGWDMPGESRAGKSLQPSGHRIRCVVWRNLRLMVELRRGVLEGLEVARLGLRKSL
jgi:hypothetical protein